jgi:hypothetical protein
VISAQFTALHAGMVGERIIFRRPGDPRPTLAQVLRAVLDEFGIGRRRAAGLRLLMITHWGVGEWGLLADRTDVLDHLMPIRGVPTARNMPVVLDYGHDNRATVYLTWRDTWLVAPADKGEAKGLDALGTLCGRRKIELPDDCSKDRMRDFLDRYPDRFAEYALEDTRIALAFFNTTMDSYRRKFATDYLPITLGGAAVEPYINHIDNAGLVDDNGTLVTHEFVIGVESVILPGPSGKPRRHKRKMDTRAFTETLASKAYMGGYNTAHEHREHVCRPDEVLLDLDFRGAYPAAAAVLPVIDWESRPREITHYEQLLRFYRGTAVGVAFAEVEFEFPADCMHPCLPVQTEYGLAYPHTGMTTCTGPEIALALQLDANVVLYHGKGFGTWFPPVWKDGGPMLAFAGYLSGLARDRAAEPKGSLMNRLLKEMSNSFYGKLAQGIEDRTVVSLRDAPKKMPPSRITCPHYAAMITGIVRTALHCMEITFARAPGCRVLSATTDGLLAAVPRIRGVDYGDGTTALPSASAAIADFWNDLETWPAIQLLKQGGINLGLTDPWLEVKHVGDRAVTVKTRGGLVEWHGVSQHLARSGHRVKEAGEYESLWRSPDPRIPVLEDTHLATLHEIATGKYPDLVRVPVERRSNTDWDGKRRLLADGTSRPWHDVEEMRDYRRTAERVRKGGLRATPLAMALATGGVQLRGGPERAIRRHVHIAIAQDVSGWRPRFMKTAEIAERLGIPLKTFYGYRRKKFVPQKLIDCDATRRIIRAEAAKLDRVPGDVMLNALLAPVAA